MTSRNRYNAASQDNRPRLIELPFPGERYADVTLCFKLPARDNLVASANRLLKMQPPPIRDAMVYERLIKTNVVSAGLSKKALEALPFPFLETIYSTLWHAHFDGGTSPWDAWMTLYLLLEELMVFQPEHLMQEDIRRLGSQAEAEPLHSYYYQQTLDVQQVITLLKGHYYRTDLLDGDIEQVPVPLRYLASRRLSQPLPWMALLSTLNDTEILRFPRLARLRLVADLIKQHVGSPQAITAQSLPDAVSALSTVLTSQPMREIASFSAVPRPFKMLVIVEGETEKHLLPLFAQTRGLDLNAMGIALHPAGGKNHVLSLYRNYLLWLRIPMFIVLDSDARAVADELREMLRPGDYIFEIEEGEFEDLYDLKLTLATINRHYQPYPEVTPERFADLAAQNRANGRVQSLRAVWQAYHLGSFDKVKFAELYGELFQRSSKPLPASIQRLLDTVINVRAKVLS